MVAVRQAQAPRQRLFDLDDRPPPPPPGTDTDTETSSYSFVNILRETQYLYALVLLISFITLAAWYSVYNAKKEDIIIESQAKGPGGKPLPITKRKKQDTDERKIGPHFGFAAKNVFRYLAAIVCLTYVGSGASMFVHAFRYDDPYRWSREGLPWAGESSVVCHPIHPNCICRSYPHA